MLELEFEKHNSIKTKCFKWIVKKVLPDYKEWKKHNKNWEKTWCIDFTLNFRPKEVKMTNKVLREKFNCVVCWSNKSQQKIIQHFTDICYKDKMKTYCIKCKKILEISTLKFLKQK